MRRGTKYLLAAIAWGFTCFWLFSYIMHLIPNDHWADFPMFLTSVVLTVGGSLGIAAYPDFNPE